jgi:NAD(P)-dependent dehydrogenase (short-subunit alcohol dehydrogenase family)
LAAEGARLVLTDLETAGPIGPSSHFVPADLRVPADVEALVASVEDGPDILVNVAGGIGADVPGFPDSSPAQWGALLDLNLRSAMLATQLVLEPMRRAGQGVIVNVASSAGRGSAAYHHPEYAAAKAGLIRFTTALADLHERLNVRVNCLVPDWVLTDRARAERAAMTAAERSAAPTPIPLEVVTDAVLTLIRDDSLFGRVMVLDPGRPPYLLD